MNASVDARRGTALAVLAAAAFGATAPFVASASASVGPFAASAVLYGGASLAALLFGGRPRTGRMLSIALPMVLAGAVVAPACFVWGLSRVGATTGSLLLNLEAVFTVLLARAVHRELITRRVGLALFVLTLGGLLAALDGRRDTHLDPLGALAIVVATAAWGLDNVLARKLGDQPPLDLVALKGLLGASVSAVVALVVGDAWPGTRELALLGLAGAIGYGLSLRLYLAAQSHMGAGRTGSVFAVAPFVGAALAWALGARDIGWPSGVAAALLVGGVALHATESTREPPAASSART